MAGRIEVSQPDKGNKIKNHTLPVNAQIPTRSRPAPDRLIVYQTTHALIAAHREVSPPRRALPVSVLWQP